MVIRGAPICDRARQGPLRAASHSSCTVCSLTIGIMFRSICTSNKFVSQIIDTHFQWLRDLSHLLQDSLRLGGLKLPREASDKGGSHISIFSLEAGEGGRYFSAIVDMVKKTRKREIKIALGLVNGLLRNYGRVGEAVFLVFGVRVMHGEWMRRKVEVVGGWQTDDEAAC